jgi:protein SCO1/2
MITPLHRPLIAGLTLGLGLTVPLTVPLTVALIGTLSLGLWGCTAETPTEPATKPCCSEELPVGELPDTSIYQLDATWHNQDGAQVRLGSLRGRPVIVAMMFTTCQYACPRLMADLKAIEAKLVAGRDQIEPRFLLVSFDAEKDLPPVLEAYATEHGLDPRRWTLLHGKDDDVRELAAVLGIKYKKSDAIGFSHSNVITLLDADGRVSHQLKGLGAEPTGLLAALRKPGD